VSHAEAFALELSVGAAQSAMRLLVAVGVVLVVARFAGRFAQRMRQPAVVGEILAGLALGPTVLGALPGNLMGQLFPADVSDGLHLLALLGVVLFVFLTGVDLEWRPSPRPSGFDLDRRKHALPPPGRRLVVAGLVGCWPPLIAGLMLGLALQAQHLEDGHAREQAATALFVAAAVTVTALPVLARILDERPLADPRVGVVALVSATISDVVAWCLLTAALILHGTHSLPSPILFALCSPLVFAMLAGRLRRHRKPQKPMVVVVIFALAGIATIALGLHPVIGAFIFGFGIRPVVQDHQRTQIRARVGPIARFLLPLFFTSAGLSVNVGTLDSAGWLLLAAVLAAAVGSKFLGGAVAGRLVRLPAAGRRSLAILLNARGLTEIVLADIGRRNGIITPTMFTALVLTAILTTTATVPLLTLSNDFDGPLSDRCAEYRWIPQAATAEPPLVWKTARSTVAEICTDHRTRIERVARGPPECNCELRQLTSQRF